MRSNHFCPELHIWLFWNLKIIIFSKKYHSGKEIESLCQKRWWWYFRNYFSACYVVWCCTLTRWSAVISTSHWGTQALIPLHFLCFSHPLTPLYSTKPSLAMLWTFSLQHHSMSQLAWPSYAYCAQRGGKSSPCRWQAPSELSWCAFIYTKLYIPSADERGWSVEHWHLFCSFTSWVFTTWFTAKLPFSLTIQCYL